MIADLCKATEAKALLPAGNGENRSASSSVAAGLLDSPTTAPDANREAPRSPARRDAILAKVTHELRTPLSSILMTTAFLLEERAPHTDAVARHLGTIHSAARTMLRLVEDLLDVSTRRCGRLALARAPLRVADLFRRADMMLHPIADGRNIALTFTEASGIPVFSADEGRLVQVILNLVGNAIKFSEAGARITVSAAIEVEHVVFRISDTGPGISPTDLPHVFDRYWQGSTARHRGVGLGLAIVREIVRGHGGSLEVSSDVGVGSTFVVSIPLR